MWVSTLYNRVKKQIEISANIHRKFTEISQKSGKGCEVTAISNGRTVYRGEWVSDRRHGDGVYEDGLSIYEGQWVHGKVNLQLYFSRLFQIQILNLIGLLELTSLRFVI